MDPSFLPECLDSLWFFSNVLSPHSSPQKIESFDQTHQEPIKSQEKAKPISQILEKIQKNAQIEENSVPIRIISRQSVEKKEKKKMKKKKKRRRNRKSLTKELDLAHGYDPGVFWEAKFGRHGCGAQDEEFETEKTVLTLPINDCIAMKEQLRTWAHAVASSVR